MSWLGWLTKPHIQVTALDRLIEWAEFAAVVGAFYLGLLIAVKIQRWRRK